jgi:hypothetical protein
MSLLVVHDAIHANISHLPAGQVAGYTTGSPDIRWTAGDWAAHPGAVRIDQDAAASDGTADVLDVERGAATPAECPWWAHRAGASFASANRPGQRRPAIYMSASNVTAVVTALKGVGVTGGVSLWVANWNLSQAQAGADVAAAAGPFPIVGVQFTDAAGFYDTSVFSSAWLTDVADAAPPPPAKGPYPHKTDGHLSLAAIAASRNISLDTWLALQRKLNPADAEKLLAGSIPPAGLTWWSINP